MELEYAARIDAKSIGGQAKLCVGTGQWLAAFESRLRVRFALWSQSASVSRPVPSEIDKRGVLYIFIL